MPKTKTNNPTHRIPINMKHEVYVRMEAARHKLGHETIGKAIGKALQLYEELGQLHLNGYKFIIEKDGVRSEQIHLFNK